LEGEGAEEERRNEASLVEKTSIGGENFFLKERGGKKKKNCEDLLNRQKRFLLPEGSRLLSESRTPAGGDLSSAGRNTLSKRKGGWSLVAKKGGEDASSIRRRSSSKKGTGQVTTRSPHKDESSGKGTSGLLPRGKRGKEEKGEESFLGAREEGSYPLSKKGGRPFRPRKKRGKMGRNTALKRAREKKGKGGEGGPLGETVLLICWKRKRKKGGTA